MTNLSRAIRKASCRNKSLYAAVMLALLIVLAGSPAGAQEQAASLGSYRLLPGDRITVTVLGETELSGDFLIDGNGSVQLPVVGEILVGDRGIKEAEQAIVKHLEGFIQRPAVTVRFTEFRPVYVMGDVRTPGSFPFRFGDTVLNAVAQAGGFGVAAELPATARTEFLLADERVRLIETTRDSLLVKRTRLEAQRDGSPDFDYPAAGNENLMTVVASEKEILASEQEAQRKQVELLSEQIPRLESQIKSVEEQVEFEKVQLGLVRQHLANYEKLVSSGLARQYTGIELKREEARNEGNIAGFQANISTLNIAIGESKIKIQDSENAYKKRVLDELQATRARLEEVETTLPSARQVRDLRAQQSGFVTNKASVTRRITIMRRQKDGSKLMEADVTTALSPGDIIEVVAQIPGKPVDSSLSLVPQEPALLTKKDDTSAASQ